MKKILLSLSLIFAFSAILISSVFATSNKIGKSEVVLSEDEVYEGDYFAAGETVTISGVVNGDAYVAGGNVLIEGIVNGDLLAAGGNVVVRGDVADDARIVGGQVAVNGKIGRNLSLGGGVVSVSDSANVGGSLVAGGGVVTVFGPVAKSAKIGAGTLTIGSKIGGNVEAGVEELVITSKGEVDGDLIYWSKAEAKVQPGASVVGETVHNFPPEKIAKEISKDKGIFAGAGLGLKIISLLASLIIGLLLLKLFPIYMQNTVGKLRTKPWLSLGVGFLTLILFPIAFIILLITIIGIPVALILLPLYLISIYLAKIYVSLFAGEKILEYFGQSGRRGWAMLLGLVVYGIFTSIPIVGNLIGFFVILFGLGVLVLVEKDLYKELTSKKLI